MAADDDFDDQQNPHVAEQLPQHNNPQYIRNISNILNNNPRPQINDNKQNDMLKQMLA